MMNGNPSGDVPMTFMERPSFINVGMMRMKTMVLCHNSVLVRVVYVNSHSGNVGPRPTFQIYVLWILSSFAIRYSLFHSSLFFFMIRQTSLILFPLLFRCLLPFLSTIFLFFFLIIFFATLFKIVLHLGTSYVHSPSLQQTAQEVRCVLVVRCLGFRGCRYNKFQVVSGITILVKREMGERAPSPTEYPSCNCKQFRRRVIEQCMIIQEEDTVLETVRVNW